MLSFFGNMASQVLGSLLGPQRAPQKPPQKGGPPGQGGGPPKDSGIGGNPEAAAELQAVWAEGSTAPAEAKGPEEKKSDAAARQDKGAEEGKALPPGDRADQREQLDLERRALDPRTPLSDGEQQKLAEKADPQHMRPEDVLKMRGIPAQAIETIRTSGDLDAQETAKVGSPDLQNIYENGTKRPATQADVDASHTNVRSDGKAMPAMTGAQKSDVVGAQAALSEDMKVGADVRKAVPMEGVADMIAGVGGRNPSMFGDFGLKRNTEGQTAQEAVATLGLDYSGSKYVQKGAGGKYDFADSVKNEGVMMIDTAMTPDMLAKAQVPLGHDVFAAAQKQAKDLAERKAAGEDVTIPPMLQTDAAGNMAHAFERNRTGTEDPRTGAGNSTVEHRELLDAAEAQRPGQQVNVVNQEMKIGGAGGGAVPLPADQGPDGKSKSQLNLVQPDGSVVNVANLVPVTDKDGKPVMIDDGTGKMIPKTRWALNLAPPDAGGMPPELKATWMERVFNADQANRAAIATKNAEIEARNADRRTRGESEEPLKPLPDPIPELAGYTPPDKGKKAA